jgi:heme/copper-type cytochrome/quinol oxidase subunit 2
MGTFFLILMAVALAMVVASLLMGLLVMARGGATAKKYSNKLMQLRVVLQAVAILIILIAVFFLRRSS